MGLYSWGCNSFGQLALQRDAELNNEQEDIYTNNRNIPTKGDHFITIIIILIISTVKFNK